MPFDTHVVAIKWNAGRYEVLGQAEVHLNTSLLISDGVLRDVSDIAMYRDEAGVVHKRELPRYFLGDSTYDWQRAAKEWYEQLDPAVTFIFIHRAEWEGGLTG